MKKKVLYLITKATWGGAQKYVFDLATHLPKEQFQVSIAYGLPAQAGESGRLKKMLDEKDIPTHCLPSLGRDVAIISDIASFFQILTLLRAERPDVLHVNSSKAAALGALAARLSGVPKIIFTAHGWPFKEDRNAIVRAIIYFVSWFTTLLSHATIVVSKRDEEIGKRMWIVGKKVRYVRLGIETPAFFSREEAWQRLHKLGFTKPKFSVVTIAELTKNKGIAYAIEAVAELKKRSIDYEYFIIGDGELRSELEQQARALNVADRIHFLGFVENAPEYLKAFDLFLLPSIKEGTPYVFMEAAAANLPIVATNVINPSFVAPADSHALADAIEGRIKGLQNATLSVNSLEQMIKQTCALYH